VLQPHGMYTMSPGRWVNRIMRRETLASEQAAAVKCAWRQSRETSLLNQRCNDAEADVSRARA